MTQKQEIKLAIKDDLLEQFRKNAPEAGSLLSSDWLYNTYMPTLDARETKLMEEAVNELIQEGLIEYVGGRKPTYRLTEKGEQALC